MRILKEAKIPFLVGGAFALRAYTGIVRDTKDFDLMVKKQDVPRILETFKRAGFRGEMAFPHWLAKIHHGETFIDVIFNSGNGLCPVDDLWMENGRDGELLGISVQLCPPEELIWQKAFIMERERFDGADVIHLIHSCATQLDWQRLLQRFGSDWSVLLAHLVLFEYVYPSRRGVIPHDLMDNLLARAAQENSKQVLTPTQQICNGTLLSRAQYLPDIERWGFEDARKVRCVMTPEQLDIWTSAIDTNPKQ